MVCIVPSVCLSIRKSCQRHDCSELGNVRNWVDHCSSSADNTIVIGQTLTKLQKSVTLCIFEHCQDAEPQNSVVVTDYKLLYKIVIFIFKICFAPISGFLRM